MMRRILHAIAPVLHLTRVTTAFAAVANVWLIVLWTRVHEAERGLSEVEEGPLWLLLLGGTVAALGLFAFGASLNDILDLRRDRSLHPERPLASGQIRLETALFLVAGTLAAAVLGATVFGTVGVMLTLLVATAIMGYNAAGKFIPAIGLPLLGLIYSGHMVIPNVRLVFVWPVLLVLTHALIVAALVHVVSGKTPPISRRAVVAAVVGWVFWSAVILLIGRRNGLDELWPSWVNPWAGIVNASLAVLYILFVWRKLARFGRGPRSAEKIGRYGSLWLALYACGWFVGQGEVFEALIIGALSATGLAGMTAMREAYGLVEQPPGFRR
jgi:hypothetical protein